MKSLEKDLLKAAKAASKQHKGSDITAFISGKDQDELALRDKLVSKLKEKEIEKMKQYGENLKDSSFIFSDEGSMEEISDEDLVIKILYISSAIFLSNYLDFDPIIFWNCFHFWIFFHFLGFWI